MLRRHKILGATAAVGAVVAGVIATAAAVEPGSPTSEPNPAPSTSTSNTQVGPTIPELPDLPAPPGLDELAPGLLGPAEMGVPDTWSAFDLDPILLTLPDYAPEADPLRGAASCPPGSIRDDSAPWIARRYSSVDQTLDNGLLSVETVLELEPEADFAADVARLDECEPGEGATLTRASGVVDLPVRPAPGVVDTTEMTITSTATDEVPYASRITIVTVHGEGFTVTVIFSGVDAGEPWGEAAAVLAAKVLAALADPSAS